MIVTLSATPTLPCGVTVHNLVAHRAATHYFENGTSAPSRYPDIISRYPGSLSAGAAFPDFLFVCGGNGSAGEFAHWVPFQAAAVEYVRMLPRPWSSDTEKLVAFLFGIVSHYVADILWHGLDPVPFGAGLIEVLGAQDFGCWGNLHNCHKAHDAADIGGEFHAAAQVDLEWERAGEWEVPAAHLVSIFRLAGVHVQRRAIEECSVFFRTLYSLTRTFGAALYEILAARAPGQGPCVGNAELLADILLPYSVGGVDDMAAWSLPPLRPRPTPGGARALPVTRSAARARQELLDVAPPRLLDRHRRIAEWLKGPAPQGLLPGERAARRGGGERAARWGGPRRPGPGRRGRVVASGVAAGAIDGQRTPSGRHLLRVRPVRGGGGAARKQQLDAARLAGAGAGARARLAALPGRARAPRGGPASGCHGPVSRRPGQARTCPGEGGGRLPPRRA